MGFKGPSSQARGLQAQIQESEWLVVPRLWECRFSIREYECLLVPKARH